MAVLSIISAACLVHPSERTRAQSFLVGLVNRWITIRYWWPRNAKKLDVTTFRGQQFYETLVDYRTWALYDKDGYLFGWHGQNREGYAFFTPVSEVHGDKKIRMRLLSRLRSPKIGR